MNSLQVRSVWTPALFAENVFWLRSKRAEASLKLFRSLDWSDFFFCFFLTRRPGSNLLENICVAEIHFLIWSLSLSFISFLLLQFSPQCELISMGAPSFWYHNLYCIVWAYVEWLGEARFIYPSLWGLHSSFPPCSLSAPSFLAPLSLFFLLSER